MNKYACMNIFIKSSTHLSEMTFIIIVKTKNLVSVTDIRPDEIFSELKPHRNMSKQIILFKYNKSNFTLIYIFTKFNVEYILSSNLANLIHYLRKFCFQVFLSLVSYDYIIILPYQYIWSEISLNKYVLFRCQKTVNTVLLSIWNSFRSQ